MDGPKTSSENPFDIKQGFSGDDAKIISMNTIETEELNETFNQPCTTSADELHESEEKSTSEISSDGGYSSSSDEEKSNNTGSALTAVNNDLNKIDQDQVMREIIEKYHFDTVPAELKPFVLGANQGLPNDYSVPVDVKPDWLDVKKFKIGQKFARKYFIGVNTSEMMALYVLFALPDGLETLIFSGNSSTPFTSFRRYLSTVLRVSSWYDHDIWSKDNPGYQNIKTVRAMHLNISKKINSTSHENLKDQVTLAGSSSKPPIWSTELKDILQEDVRSECLFKVAKPIHSTIPGKVFVNQLDMSTTQFGFVGLMIAYPEKFGAAGATKEELEGFIHTWRCIGYLLGMDDKYNFCSGTLDEVTQRCHSFVENWAKPNFQHLTEDWEHMSRCLAEGMSYCASSTVMSFEVSIMFMCWVLDIPAPRLYASLKWSQRLEFHMLRFMMTTAVKFPGVLPMLNWFMRRSLARASSMTPEEMKTLENKKYDYQTTKNAENKVKKSKVKSNRTSKVPLLAFVYLLRWLI